MADLSLKLVDGRKDSASQHVAVQVVVHTDTRHLSQAVNPEQFTLRVPGLNETVGIDKNPIPRLPRLGANLGNNILDSVARIW